jgi:hypothetical protein
MAAKGLKESGIFLEPEFFDIDRLIRSISPRPVTASDMKKLDESRQVYTSPLKGSGSADPQFDFRAWFESRNRRKWRIGWWMDNAFEAAKAARERSQREYNVKQPDDFMNVAKGQASSGDWLLCFELRKAGVRDIAWMYTDFVVPVDPNETDSFEEDYPFQAIQVHAAKYNPEPPFVITAAFRKAFDKAARSYGLDRIEHNTSTQAPEQIIRKTYSLLR